MRALLFCLGSLAAAACTPAPAPTAAAPSSAPAPEEEAMGGGWDPSPVAAERQQITDPIPMPTACAAAGTSPPADAGADLCVPGDGFAKKLCSGPHPDMALGLLAKGTPFTRMYMRGDVDAWNAESGTSTRAKLLFDEEVLVLRRRSAPASSIVVGSGASYQVMRWDGTCYTVEGGELTTRRPPASKHASIPWTRLSDRARTALLKSAKIQGALDRRGKECKGATSGEVSKACETADTALSTTIVAELRGGFAIPAPEPLP